MPFQAHYRPSVFHAQEELIVRQEIKALLEKGVIQRSHHEPGEFISTIFLRPKSDGLSFRIILNLKEFNKSVEHHHFKMDTLDTVTKMITPGCYMASVDLKDAYYTVPIQKDHQKFLKFEFKGCLINIPASLMAYQVLTKMLKPVYSTLHNQGHISMGYIDDSYLQSDTRDECKLNIVTTVNLFTELGFYIHPNKLVFLPTQTLTFLGFILDSVKMTISPTPEKIDKIVKALSPDGTEGHTPLDVARVISLIVSLFPGAEYGPLHYRVLEHNKTNALAANAGDFNMPMELSEASIQVLLWWITYAPQAQKHICHPTPQ